MSAPISKLPRRGFLQTVGTVAAAASAPVAAASLVGAPESPAPRGENLAQMVFYRLEDVLKVEFGCNPLPWQKHRALWAIINVVLADCRAVPPPEYASWWEREERIWYEAVLEREANEEAAN